MLYDRSDTHLYRRLDKALILHDAPDDAHVHTFLEAVMMLEMLAPCSFIRCAKGFRFSHDALERLHMSFEFSVFFYVLLEAMNFRRSS